MKVYGNWCGPGWSAGQFKDAKDLTESDKNYPAKDEIDQCCKEHDIELSEAKTDEDVKRANDKFIANANKLGNFGKLLAIGVAVGGPKNLQDVFGMDEDQETKRKAEEDIQDPETKWHKLNTKRKAEEDIPVMMTTETTPAAASKIDPGISAKTKRTRTSRALINSFPNLPDNQQVGIMETADTETMVLAKEDGAGSNSGGRARKETPVLKLYNSFPWQDVVQARFKNSYFFSVNDLGWRSGNTAVNTSDNTNRLVKIRMNDYRQALLSGWKNQTANSSINPGIAFNAMCGRYIDTSSGFLNGELVPFPETNSFPVDLLPQMHLYYQRLYNAMTVVKVNWKLHVDFPNPEYSTVDATTGAINVSQVTATVGTAGFIAPNMEATYRTSAGGAWTNACRDQDFVSATKTDLGSEVYTGYRQHTSGQINSHTITTPSSNQTVQLTNYRPKSISRPFGARISMHYETEAKGAEASPESNMPTPCHLIDMERWPGPVQRHTIYNADRGNMGSSHHIFSGTWTPNWQNHNPLNDSNLKTWLSTSTNGASDTTFDESLIIQFFRSWDTAKSSLEVIGLNCWLEINYDVQFRGLKEAALWPVQNAALVHEDGTSQATIDHVLPQVTRYTTGATVPTRNNN